tara:strand:- start:274 stop:504 length:231 start_codon:yes stop_codon:yes gene_type:complete
MAVSTTDVLQSAVTGTDVIKHGTIVCSTSPVLGQVQTIDTYVINTPLHATVETKYTNKHDEISYYTTASGIDGGGA